MPTSTVNRIKDHPVVSHDQWLAKRMEFLKKEKEFTRLRDDLSRQRRELPWEKVEKQYVFDGPNGKESLADLFEGLSQLLIHHFMFNPAWDEGCKHCSFWADNWNGSTVHLNHRDVSLVAISRAPLAKLQAFKQRMGWSFKWFSSGQTDFNYDYYVSFTPENIQNATGFHNYQTVNPGMEDHVGFSVFYKDQSGAIFHTYSCYSRGVDMLNSAYHYLDLVPKGRDEDNLDFTQAWVRHHDKYEK